MEDNRDKLVVIFAGYTNEMEVFFTSNPGLKSRVSNILTFEDYSRVEIKEVAKKLLKQKKLTISEAGLNKLIEKIESYKALKDFANIRTLRNILETTYKKQASRLMSLKKSGTNISMQQLNELTEEDVDVS
jgi:hypothetical protein